MMEDYFYDEDLDEESDVRKVKLLKKKTIAKAKDYFESEKEKYGTSLESSGLSFSSEEQQKELTDYKQFVSEARSVIRSAIPYYSASRIFKLQTVRILQIAEHIRRL